MNFSTERIYLIGYMASGKTSIGQALAGRLGYDFYDTDSSIELIEDKTISEIFASMGEPYFRTLEKEVLNLTLDLDRTVIATGGGLPIPDNNMTDMLHSGITIFLDTPEEVLIKRLSNDINRPLHRNKENLISEMNARLKSRKMTYREAHLTVGLTDHKAIIDHIMTRLQPTL